MNQNVLTAPLAIIKINGEAVGKIKNLRLQEQYTRGDVRGIGTLLSSEKPILSIQCSFTASAYTIDVTRLGSIINPFAIRGATTTDQFINTLLMTTNGVDIYVLKKASQLIVDGIVTQIKEESMFVIKNAFMTSQTFDLQEQQISGTDISGEYLEPILGVSQSAE